MAAMDAKLEALAARGDKTLQKTLMKWGGQQAEQLLGLTLQAWKEFRAQLREERAADELSRRMAEASKGDGTMEKVPALPWRKRKNRVATASSTFG